MKASGNIRSVTVGIFDNAQDLDRAVERLAAAGFQSTVYDETIVAQEPGNIAMAGPVPVGPLLVPAEVPHGNQSDLSTVVRAFKSHLADYQLSEDVIDAYATFFHKGKFVVVRTHPERDEHVVKIMRQCGASRVTRLD